MERLSVDPRNPEPGVVRRAAELVRDGAVVAYPTETFYALGVNPFDASACERVFRIKGRSDTKALPLIASDLDQLALVCASPSAAVTRLAERFWPGPLTLVVPALGDLTGGLAGLLTLAVRVSGSFLARELARAARVPLTATSANRSGRSPARWASEIRPALEPSLVLPDAVLDGGRTPGKRPSTIVDLCGSEPHLLRQGIVEFAEVLAALAERGG